MGSVARQNVCPYIPTSNIQVVVKISDLHERPLRCRMTYPCFIYKYNMKCFTHFVTNKQRHHISHAYINSADSEMYIIFTVTMSLPHDTTCMATYVKKM